MKVNLGSNIINDCDAALVVNGTEVFRLRERASDGRLICDFELHNQNGERIAKVAKNRVVYAAKGYQIHDLPKECYIEAPNGEVIAHVQETGHDEIAITGDYWIEGHHVIITNKSLVSSGITMTGNIISGFGKAISVEPNSFSIGTK